MTTDETIQGYYRFPTLHDDRVVFVSEDDLWEVPVEGGVARRLTTGLGEVSYPVFSPDGRYLAFVGTDEGVTEVYVMPGLGGPTERLTFDGRDARIVGWHQRDGENHIVYASGAWQPFRRIHELFSVHPDGGEPVRIPVGPAEFITFSNNGGAALARHQDDTARWKRYRGGTAGVLWVDTEGDGNFSPFMSELNSNIVRPHWLGDRIYFVSDHEGQAEVYSATPAGEDLQRHTNHHGFYVRHPSTDGRRLVYHAGGDLFVFDPGSGGGARKIDIHFASPRPHRARRFVDADDFLEEADLHPRGHACTITARGQAFSMGLWEGAVKQLGATSGVRYRMVRHLRDGKRFVAITDEGGDEGLEVRSLAGNDGRRLELDIGRAIALEPSPQSDKVALSNHRHELIVVDLSSGVLQVLDRSDYNRIAGFSWSPDGRWIAYSIADTSQTMSIRIVDVSSGDVHEVTRGEFRDVSPCFDDKGRFLYFISYREFEAVYDSHAFDLSFPRGMRLCLVTLQEEQLSPFVPTPRPLDGDKDKDDDEDDDSDEDGDEDNPDEKGDDGKSDESDTRSAASRAIDSDRSQDGGKGRDSNGDRGEKKGKSGKDDKKEDDKPKPVDIDFDGISNRIVLFPVGAGRFGQVEGAGSKVFYTTWPVADPDDDDDDAAGTLRVFDFEERESNLVMSGIKWFRVADRKTLLIVTDDAVRVLQTKDTDKDDDEDDYPSRKNGWLDLDRVALEVIPGEEWAQMLREAWRLMRQHFWSADMSGVDWDAVYARYAPLVERVGSRREFSDLVWEMQGELGTSHAYEFGGDYRRPPQYRPGFLAANFRWNADRDGYEITHVAEGDTWDRSATSPLSRPGINVDPGDVVQAVDGKRVSLHTSVQSLLVNKAGQEVELEVLPSGDDETRHVTVRTLYSEQRARYRTWVVKNRKQVREASGGKLGYVHIPDMGAGGFSEFSRAYLSEITRPGLIVDVRFNGGGHVSPLLLEKLARTRLGYDVQRWGKPLPYPPESVLGPMVALTNENAGSDGDIFSHCFKLMNLGKLVGKRTWGGVIGIWPRHSLVDGSTTSQPEFAFWFRDVGWGVENYGTDPDIEVEVSPQDYAAGHDPQLNEAIRVALTEMESLTPLPRFDDRPNLAAPWQGNTGSE